MCIFGRSSPAPQQKSAPPAPIKRPQSEVTATFRNRNRQARGVMDNIFTSPLGVRTSDGAAAPRLTTMAPA